VKVAQCLRLLVEQPDRHFFICTPDGDGLVRLIPRVLGPVASPKNVKVRDAAVMTVGDAREVAKEAWMAPEGTDRWTHFVVRRTESMSAACVGALLLAVEDAAKTRFVFTATHRTREAETLASRATCVELPFLSRREVLGNLQALRLDARAADELDLWDGTLGGTEEAVRHAKDHATIRKAVGVGLEGLEDLHVLAKSPAFDAAMEGTWNQEERDYVARHPCHERRMLATFLALSRKS
jgi:hypothetical protein